MTMKLMRKGLMIVSGILAVVSVNAQGYKPSTNTLDKKLMFGYQGWHATPNDGAGNNVWRHWFNRNSPDSGNANFDVWPDMSEYPANTLEATNMSYPDGSPAMLYSAYKYETVDVHFKWLKEHQLDGVFEQRFLSDIRPGGGRKHFNQVVANVKKASEKYQRVFVIMYDITGAGKNWKETLVSDWKFLVDSLQVTKSKAYLHHKGRPLLAIWGFGFSHNAFATAQQVDSLVRWLHGDAEKRYQATVMGGVNDNWLTHTSDWMAVYDQLDVLSPWAVGRYRDDSTTDKFRDRAVIPDIKYCAQKKIDYLPVIFPGFSWYNLRRGRTPFNQIPRRGGDFYWRQSYNVINAGSKMVYVAMYDEVDEGTAMYKLAPAAPKKPVNGKFISADQDGIKLPPDWYLTLAEATSNILRGKEKNTANIPVSLEKKAQLSGSTD